METKFFKQIQNEQELTIRASKLNGVLELDKSENKSLKLEVEAEYESLLSIFKESEKDTNELTQDEIIEKLTPLNLEVELTGKWIWIRGDTRRYKDSLKQLNARFSPGKKCWYWRPNKFRSINKDLLDMDEIRRIYGSQVLR